MNAPVSDSMRCARLGTHTSRRNGSGPGSEHIDLFHASILLINSGEREPRRARPGIHPAIIEKRVSE